MTVRLISHTQLICFYSSIISARPFTKWLFVFTSDGHVFIFRACVIILNRDLHRYARAAICGEHDFGVTHMRIDILTVETDARLGIDGWVLGIGYLHHDMEHIAPQPP
jgi:hypothetical protein